MEFPKAFGGSFAPLSSKKHFTGQEDNKAETDDKNGEPLHPQVCDAESQHSSPVRLPTVSPWSSIGFAGCRQALQHTYGAPQPIDGVAAELPNILAVHRREQRAIEHEPGQTGGFQGPDHALSFDIGIPRSAMSFSII
jgi:hypothetical protein